MHFTLFIDGYFVNQYDATCFVALEEKQVPYSTARALLREGQGFPALMHERTPITRVPALAHGDFWLTESIAIAEYLEDVLPPPSYPRLFPADPQRRARARQLMAWIRIEMAHLRESRPWFTCVYRDYPVGPLSPLAEREARELVDVAARLAKAGELVEWNISHVDLVLTLLRLVRSDLAFPPAVQQFFDENMARPSVKAYVNHQRPPNPPP